MRQVQLLFSIAICVILSAQPLGLSAMTVQLSAEVPGCGDGIVGIGEQCDGSNLGGATCSSKNFTGGSLSCTSACTLNTSYCTLGPINGAVGGGSLGGSRQSGFGSINATYVVFTGKAYPKSTVTVLNDTKLAAIAVADANANFQITISGISGGNHSFSIYSEDIRGIRSSLLTFPINVTSGAITLVSGIFISPTVSVDKSEVKQGDGIAIYGQSAPAAEITATVNSEAGPPEKTIADANGAYLLNFNTSALELGRYFAKSKAALNGEASLFSQGVSFAVGMKNILALTMPATPGSVGDVSVTKLPTQNPSAWHDNYCLIVILIIIALMIAYLTRRSLSRKQK